MTTGTTGTTLIKAIREDTAKYPHICTMLLDLYDSKVRETIDKEVDYAEDLFINNPNEKARFIEYLDELEKEDPEGMFAKITESKVILFYQTPMEITFFRKNLPLQSIDYMA